MLSLFNGKRKKGNEKKGNGKKRQQKKNGNRQKRQRKIWQREKNGNGKRQPETRGLKIGQQKIKTIIIGQDRRSSAKKQNIASTRSAILH